MVTQRCPNCDGDQSPPEDLQSTSSRLTAASPSLEFSLPLLPKPTGKVGTENEGMAKHSGEDVKKNGYHCDSDETKVAQLSPEKENYRQTLKQPSPKEQTESEGKNNGDVIHDKNEPNGDRQQMTMKGKESSKDLTHNCDSQEDGEERESERRIQHRLLEHMFGTAKEAQTQQAKVKDTERVESGIDFIPALRSREWPKVAREWIKRERKRPSPDIVEKIIQEGYHLVVKSPKKNGNLDCDFRISFSHAEYLLSREMNDIQLQREGVTVV